MYIYIYGEFSTYPPRWKGMQQKVECKLAKNRDKYSMQQHMIWSFLVHQYNMILLNYSFVRDRKSPPIIPRGVLACMSSMLLPWFVLSTSLYHIYLVGGLEYFLFSHILGIIIPTDFHIFQRGSNHQPGTIFTINHDTNPLSHHTFHIPVL